MKFNKEIGIILILGSLLLSAIGAALYLYYENENTKVENSKTVTVYVAKDNIKKDQLIKKEHIAKINIQKKYILTKPLLLNDVENKYAKENIYKNETFIKEKLTAKVIIEKPKNLAFKNNIYNMGFKLFKNPNYSLKKGDLIKIASVRPFSKDKKNMKYKVRFVADQLKVIGFLEKGKHVEKPRRVEKQQIKSKKASKETKPKFRLVTVFADDILIDMPSETLLELLNDYNIGEQLWMARTNKDIVKVIEKPKEKKKGIKKPKKIIYNFVLYRPRNISYNKTATIEYLDKKIPRKSSSVTLTDNLQAQCNQTNKYLIGASRVVDLRTKPSLKAKIVRKVRRNYIIPYKKVINKDWIEVCDGTFVHQNEANFIDAKKVKGILSGKQKAK